MSSSRSPRRIVPILAPSLAWLVAVIPVTAADPPVVRNHAPQRAVAPPDVQNPIYYPMKGRPAAADGELAMTAEQLMWQLRELHSTLRHEEALLVADQLVALVPEHPIAHYNRACVLARLRRVDDALLALDTAVDRGWRQAAHTRFDYDLDPLRHHARFDRIMKRMRELRRSERLLPTPMRGDAWPGVVEDLNGAVPSLLDRYQVPGAAVALIHEHDVVWTGGFGVARRGSDTPVSDEATFDVRAPIDLLAVIATFQQQAADERFDVAGLLAYSMETLPEPRSRAPGTVTTRLASDPAFFIGNRDRAGSIIQRMRPPPAPSNERTLALLQTAVEIQSEQRFDDYCRQHILRPSGAGKTGFAGACDAERDVAGHTSLGTPLDSAAPDGELRTTAGDLAHVVRALQADTKLRTGVHQVGGLGRRLGLRMTALTTPDGLRMQVAGEEAGVGCLIRWYPDRGSGVVVLYNREGGLEAAERIAHLALGGS